MNHRTGFLFEWDGFCDTLKLAFEDDGIQHHEYPNPFYQKYDVQNLKEHKVWT